MQNKYEKPSIEIIEFEVKENILDSTGFTSMGEDADIYDDVQ